MIEAIWFNIVLVNIVHGGLLSYSCSFVISFVIISVSFSSLLKWQLRRKLLEFWLAYSHSTSSFDYFFLILINFLPLILNAHTRNCYPSVRSYVNEKGVVKITAKMREDRILEENWQKGSGDCKSKDRGQWWCK